MLISYHVLKPLHSNQAGQPSNAECYESITTACEAKHIKRASFYKNVQDGRAEVDGWVITYGEMKRDAGASDSTSNSLTGNSADMVDPPCPATAGSTETIGILSQPSAVPLPKRTVAELPSQTAGDAASSNGTSDSNDLPNTMRSANNNHASNNDDAAGNDPVIGRGGGVDDDVEELHETTFVDSQSEEDDEDEDDIEFLPTEGMVDEPF